MRSLGLTLVFAFVLGCSAKIEKRAENIPPAGIRIAVLPFASVDENGSFFVRESNYFIDELGVITEKEKLSPEESTRRAVYNELYNTPFEVISPALIDVDLPHRGFISQETGELDIKKLYNTPASVLCKQVFECDAILYGKLHEWDSSYYGLESVTSVDISIQIQSAASDKELYFARIADSKSSGLSKGPTGYFSLAVEPIKAFGSEEIEELMTSSVTKLVEPFEELNKLPIPDGPPPAIFASAHTTTSGQIDRMKGLQVLVFGTEKKNGWFSIKGVARRIPLHESAEGRYVGKFFPLERELFEERPVKVYLADEYGRVSSQPVPGADVSLR